jgi:hypothetical protein
MFEKPQYLTPDGYRRLPARPKVAGEPAGASARQAKKDLAAAHARMRKMEDQRKGISPEAAQLIAAALKTMLKAK